MENDQKNPQAQSNLGDSQKSQPTTENSQVNTPGQTPGPDNSGSANQRNYSEESANIDTSENKDYSSTPADRQDKDNQPLNKSSETKKEDDENLEEEVKEMPHPHKRSTPESDDDFKHDM